MWERRAFQAGDVIPGPRGLAIRIVRFIADGGFSEVYEAVCDVTGELYAVKALRAKHKGNAKTRERQRREAQTLYRLKHPNVVRVHHIGMRLDDDLFYMVMDLLVGRNLRELQRDFSAIQRDDGAKSNGYGRLPVTWALEIMTAVCAGLDAMHEHAIHRDLKPENIYVCDDGRVCLLDIGSAKFPKEMRLTTRDVTIGTASYMSPEQLQSPDTVDGRSDLFNVGVILYELLSGRHPFAIDGILLEDRFALAMRIIQGSHVSLCVAAPHLSDDIISVVERLLQKAPSARYPRTVVVRDLIAASHVAFVHRLGDLAPPPIAEAIAKIPRIKEDEPRPTASLPADTNPFVTVSMPPEEPRVATDPRSASTTVELPAVPSAPRLMEDQGAESNGGDREASFPPEPAFIQGAHQAHEVAVDPAGRDPREIGVLPITSYSTSAIVDPLSYPKTEDLPVAAFAGETDSPSADVDVPEAEAAPDENSPVTSEVALASSPRASVSHSPAPDENSSVTSTPALASFPDASGSHSLDPETRRLAEARAGLIPLLPEALRVALVLHDVEHKSVEEVAVLTGATVAEIQARVAAARARLNLVADKRLIAAGIPVGPSLSEPQSSGATVLHRSTERRSDSPTLASQVSDLRPSATGAFAGVRRGLGLIPARVRNGAIGAAALAVAALAGVGVFRAFGRPMASLSSLVAKRSPPAAPATRTEAPNATGAPSPELTATSASPPSSEPRSTPVPPDAGAPGVTDVPAAPTAMPGATGAASSDSPAATTPVPSFVARGKPPPMHAGAPVATGTGRQPARPPQASPVPPANAVPPAPTSNPRRMFGSQN